jgi:HK97 family phage prohead protease
MTLFKRNAAQFKMLVNDAGEPTGEVEFYAAKFGNVDLVGDRMVKGSFAKSLDEWRKSGNPIPVVFSHKWDDPFAMIGDADPANVVEDDIGLKVKAMLDIHDNPTAMQVFRMMRKRSLNEASFAYDVVHETGLKKGNGGANDITEVKLLEVGPTLKGANPDTVGVLSAKSRPVKTKDGPLPGSIEATQAAIINAVSGKGGATGVDDDTFHYIVATYTDHAVVATCDYDGGDGGTKYNSYPYTLTADGSVELGDPTEVELQTHVTTVAKGDEPDGTKADVPDTTKVEEPGAVKAGARNSTADQNRVQAIHDAAISLGADCTAETKSAAKSAPAKDDEKDGKDGKDGEDGKDGKDGKDSADAGKDGKDGEDGKDGKDGKPAPDAAADGKDGKDGEDGKDGKDEEDDKPDKKPAGKSFELELLELESFTL